MAVLKPFRKERSVILCLLIIMMLPVFMYLPYQHYVAIVYALLQFSLW